ncbi:MAG: hypothetical protein ACW97Z_05395 [Candidatus Hodarchaeales archaeon]
MVEGCLLLFSFIVLINLTGLSRSLLKFEILFFFPFLVYLMIILTVKYLRLDTKQYFFPIVMVFALLIQLLILTTNVSLSDDIYRFILEGKMVLNGLNPYITSLNDVPTSFTSEFLHLVNNDHITSPYPPLALFLFTVLAWIWENPLLFRIVFSSSFILSIIALDKLLSTNDKWKIIIFAWNPLFHLETGNGSHFEAVIVLLIIFALLSMENNRKELASILFLATFFLKYYTIFIIPLFWRHMGRKGQRIIMIGLLGYIVSAILNPPLISGLLTFANEWYFNASIIWILSELTKSLFLSQYITGTIFIVILSIVIFTAQQRKKLPYDSAGLVIGLFLLLQPTFHPWYLFWLFPFILLNEKTIPWSWIVLSGLIIFSYNVYILYDTVNVWKESVIVRLVQYLPFYLIFLYENRTGLVSQVKAIKSLFKKRKNDNPSTELS